MGDGAWRRVLAGLRAQGWDVELTGTAAPVQLVGRVPSGEAFYYRCRYELCELDIGPDDELAWAGEEQLEGEYTASYLEPDEAIRILLHLHTRWRTEIS